MLTLPIKKKWFDMIKSGVKKEEYREIKPYYDSRFKIYEPYLSDFENIIFRNGYRKDIPKIHPTQKPVNLLKQLIKIFTDEGDVVIDPVAGSGSTLRACAELNRSCYGFEIKRDFVKRAKEEMLSNIKKQQTLFD